jgi:hypothetical protein
MASVSSHTQIALPTLIRGFDAALVRFQAAAAERDAEAAFHPLFEALAWTYGIDDRLNKPDLPALRGLRWARRKVHHQWADALYVADVAHVISARRPAIMGPHFFEWRWRPELARGRERDNADRNAYREYLSDQPARTTLASVSEFLAPQRVTVAE